MAVTINASTSAGLVMTSDLSGVLTLQQNGTTQATVDSNGLTATAIIPSGSTAPTNGMFLPAANAIGLSTSSTERMRIDSSGNVGIGTSSPLGKLKVIVGDVAPAASGSMNTGVIYESVAGARAINIGTSNAAGYSWINAAYTNNSGIADNLVLMTGAAERMRINSAGKVAIGSTGSGNGVKLEVVGDTSPDTLCSFKDTRVDGASGAPIMYFQRSATVGSITTSTSSTSYNTSSDYRLKENIAPMTGALDLVQQLKPVTYNWKVDGSSGQGFIAHELQAVVPNCVVGEKDAVETIDDVDADGKVIGTKEVPRYQGIDTSFLVATLTAAIQELNAKVDAQAAEIQALKGAK